MSHIVTIQTQVRDSQSIVLACQRLQLPEPVYGSTKLFTAEATGWQVRLTDWRYPVVCDTERGCLHYDNFNGRWGNQARLDEFLQTYAVVTATSAARRQGHSVSERWLADGSIQLSIQVGAA